MKCLEIARLQDLHQTPKASAAVAVRVDEPPTGNSCLRACWTYSLSIFTSYHDRKADLLPTFWVFFLHMLSYLISSKQPFSPFVSNYSRIITVHLSYISVSGLFSFQTPFLKQKTFTDIELCLSTDWYLWRNNFKHHWFARLKKIEIEYYWSVDKRQND